MKAFILDRYKTQALRLGDMPEPVPGPDDVLVEVEAAGLNLLDSKVRGGEFKPILPYKTPLVLGRAGIRRKAKRAGVDYSFLYMRSDGAQLQQITKLIEDGTIRPVVDRVFPFERLNDAFAYIETGRAKGKVVVTLK